MTDREKLPANTVNRSVTVSVAQRGSLVARGLAAIQTGTKLALMKDRDTLYRQAREVYDLITDCGGTSWVGERGRKWVPISALTEAFITFQRLAAEGYGKAYYPLSTLYGGEQSVKEDEELARHFRKMARDWCLANSSKGDPEIWNDLGICYLYEDNDQAVYWFRKAAEQGHAWGLLNLAMMYDYGWGVEEDGEESRNLQTMAAEQGNLVAILRLIDQLESNGPEHEPYDDEQALYWYRKAAEQGYPWSEADFGAERFFDLGMLFRYGDEVDEDKAEEYFRAASNLGYPEAQYRLAELLSEMGEDANVEHWLKSSADLGYGPAQLAYAEYPFVPENEAAALIDSALDWYKAQAESGGEVCQYEYATMLLNPTGNWRSNPEEGMRWLKASAEQCYLPALKQLGKIYLSNKSPTDTIQDGEFLLSRAGDLGDPSAYELLGDFYLQGYVDNANPRQARLPLPLVKPDQSKAITCYELAIGTCTPMGDKQIAFKLGRHYLTGEHLQQDLQLAEKWLLHSAEHGYGSAQELLGDEYLSGRRLHKDIDAAIRWLELAGESSVAARLKLAGIYLDGKVVPQCLSEAIDWLTRDPDGTGHMNRQMKLVAEKCFDGRFGNDEETVAYQWLEQMAIREIEEAIMADIYEDIAPNLYYNVGEIRELGLGVAKDMETAISWYKKAAGQGHHTAKVRLQKLGVDWKLP